jgi:hypothetical protein
MDSRNYLSNPLHVSSDEISSCIDDLRIEEIQYGRLFRAISRGCTILDAKESREFFDRANFISFCCLSINFFEETRQKWKKESFYLFLNYSPAYHSRTGLLRSVVPYPIVFSFVQKVAAVPIVSNRRKVKEL